MTAGPKTRPARLVRVPVVPALLRVGAAVVLLGGGAVLFRSLRPQGQPGPWLVAGWTALTCAVLWLTRRALEQAADRIRFGGDSSYHAMRVLLRQLAAALPVDEVVPRLAESLGRSTHAARTEVRIALDGDERWTQVWPPAALPPIEPLTMQIRHLGSSVGEVVFDTDAAAGSDRRRLDQLTGTAGLAMSTVKQTWELRRRVADLQLVNAQLRTSQARLRSARSIEQARLQAEVDARVVPAVRSAAAVMANLADAPAGTPLPPAALTALTQASKALADALDTLRSIARGIYPPRLDEDGLPASLRSWADLTGEPLTLDVAGTPNGPLADPDVQTCLYFCIVTVLQAGVSGTGRHRGVQLRFEVDAVHFTVGLGLGPGDRVPEPVLLAVRDRIEAFDGQLHTSIGVAGVVVSGTLPIAASPVDHRATALVPGTTLVPGTAAVPLIGRAASGAG